MLVKAICESTGRKLAAVKESLKKEGDLGLVAAVRDFPTGRRGIEVFCADLAVIGFEGHAEDAL